MHYVRCHNFIGNGVVIRVGATRFWFTFRLNLFRYQNRWRTARESRLVSQLKLIKFIAFKRRETICDTFMSEILIANVDEGKALM